MKLSLRLTKHSDVNREVWRRLSPETRFAILGLGLLDFDELRVDDVMRVERAFREEVSR